MEEEPTNEWLGSYMNTEEVKFLMASLEEECRRLLEFRFIKGYTANELVSRLGYENLNAVYRREAACKKSAGKIMTEDRGGG